MYVFIADTLTATCTMTGTSAVNTEKISGTVNFEQVVRLHICLEWEVDFH